MVIHSLLLAVGRVINAAKSGQSCPTLCDPIDGSPPGSPIPGILQARTLEWVAISFYNRVINRSIQMTRVPRMVERWVTKLILQEVK